ncbi:MAG: hypothetical protein GX258_03740 [Clostridiales bacterium]|nr:hypothetical protein [Clostridiales bacterium]
MKIEYRITSNNKADIFGEVAISKLVIDLYKEECEVLSINVYEESLESYYLNLIGGKKND